jgi:hypothetical protein
VESGNAQLDAAGPPASESASRVHTETAILNQALGLFRLKNGNLENGDVPHFSALEKRGTSPFFNSAPAKITML